jgi:hypothetical protein
MTGYLAPILQRQSIPRIDKNREDLYSSIYETLQLVLNISDMNYGGLSVSPRVVMKE